MRFSKDADAVRLRLWTAAFRGCSALWCSVQLASFLPSEATVMRLKFI